ncbi:PAS domain-containing hybrid sensor histidine kinase/response regulator [Shimia haliotis]|uniref:Sensory/regulatory protein RpfC n=1 Tax=Shimia haliotis TaxID=1280847 RepID=A0A1I4DFD7_9RHOB|nr:ATP-binding protein [Shimia haliotis]SFK91905.1 hypothetical protein SAMN04488036_103118 [Shimia haliotis]
MANAIFELEQALADFDARRSPLGKLNRYRQSRIGHVFNRVVFIFMGALAIGFLIDPMVALAATSIYLIGEAVDTWILTKLPDWIEKGMPLTRAECLALFGSFLQTTTVCVFIGFTWIYVPRESSMILCLSLIGGSVVNALNALTLNRVISIMRIGMFAILVVSLALIDLQRFDTFPTYVIFNLIGTLMLVYLLVPFVAESTHERRKGNMSKRRLIAQGLALARANESLYTKQQESRRLALVVQHASDAVTLVDSGGKIVWVNKAFTTLTGYSFQEVLGKKSSLFFNEPGVVNKASQMIEDALRSGSSGKVTNESVAKDGSKRWLETSFGPVWDDAGQLELLFIIDRDVSDIKSREAELEDARVAAEKGERSQSSFLATMSHEIRTPMNGIIGMTELLSKSDLSDTDRLYVDTIQSSSEALLTIINDILDFSKLNDGHLTIKPTTFALYPSLHEVMNLMRPLARAKGLELVLNCQADLPKTVLGDGGRLRQVLINVIGNAIKFTDSGSVTLAVSGRQDNGELHLNLEVSDTGIGIPEDQLDQVFERFAQADTASTRRFGGTGLGLSISRRLVQLMRGDIQVHSVVERGSCFSISVVLGISKCLTVTQSGEDRAEPDALLGTRVLLAEDNMTNRLVVQKFLQGSGVTLITAENGAEAVDVSRKLTPEVILMDMSMPVMDGLEATRRIRALDIPQPVIIALTANAYSSDRETCLDAGMDAFLSKPVRRGQLLHELSLATAKARAHSKAS